MNEVEVNASPDEVFDGIKNSSDVKERMARDTGNTDMNVEWEALDAMLAMPDNRPAPTRTHAGANPERQMGVLLSFEGEKQAYAPMYEPDPDAEKGKPLRARKMSGFGDAEAGQIVSERMKGNKNIHLFLAEGLTDTYQLGGAAVNNEMIIVAPKGLEWETGKYAFLLESGSEDGFVVGGRPHYVVAVSKFLLHLGIDCS